MSIGGAESGGRPSDSACWFKSKYMIYKDKLFRSFKIHLPPARSRPVFLTFRNTTRWNSGFMANFQDSETIVHTPQDLGRLVRAQRRASAGRSSSIKRD